MKCRVISSIADNIDGVCEDIRKAINSIDYDFAILAVSDMYNLLKIKQMKEIPQGKCLMFSAVDSFANDKIIQKGVTALFIQFERDGKIECFAQDNLSTQRDRVLQETISYLKSKEDCFHLIVTGICNDNIAYFIEDLNKSGVKVDNIQGGVSSVTDINGEISTWQIYNGQLIKDGFVIVSFSNVEMATSVAMGFQPVGVRYEVTKANGYTINTVDDKPFRDTIEMLSKDIDNFKSEYLWYTPILVLDETIDKSMTLRTFKEINEDGVEFFGPIKESQKIRLTYGEVNMLLEADKESAKEVKQEISNPELILNFSCVGRQYILEDRQLEENQIYIESLKAPLFGFFTFGEIGHSPQRDSLQFYNETSLLTAIREK